MDISDKVLEAFQIEHAEHLEAIRSCLQKLEDASAAPDPRTVELVFRTAHTLKGGARICGLSDVETLAHALESHFAELRDTKSGLTADAARVVRKSLDAIEDWMAALFAQSPKPDLAGVLAETRELAGKQPDKPLESRAAPASGTGAQSHIGAAATDGPAEGARRPGADAPTATADHGASAPATPENGRLDTLRVRAENLDLLLRSADVLVARCAQSGSLEAACAAQADRLESLQRTLAASRRGVNQAADTRVRDDASRSLCDLEAELKLLIRDARRLQQHQRANAWELSSLGRELQGHVRGARMVPAESVYQGLRKMVRDLAGECGKQIEFRCEGLDARADRMVLQVLKAPLMHLLRNAIAHGIETPEERAAAGKPAGAVITLTLQADADRMRVAVSDDGRGLDTRAIHASAVRTGLLAPEDPELDIDDAARLILHPGMTTAARVDEVSGRGVGLTDVRETVAGLQGELHVSSIPGRGATFEISVPVSIATHRVLIVEAAGQRFALPVNAILRLLTIRRADLQSIEGRPIVPVDGSPVRVLHLSSLIGIRESVPCEDDQLDLVVIRTARTSIALVVDRFIDERASLIKPLPSAVGWTPVMNGGIVLEDGTVCLVLSPAELVDMSEGTVNTSLPAFTPTATQDAPSTILIVDDSLTTRTLEKGLLESEGFNVRIATDGIEALEMLRESPADLIVTDIEMPRLDGFGLVERVKSDPTLASIPMIIVSSMKREEHLERGMSLGADAYIVKQRFDHEELLSAVRQFI